MPTYFFICLALPQLSQLAAQIILERGVAAAGEGVERNASLVQRGDAARTEAAADQPVTSAQNRLAVANHRELRITNQPCQESRAILFLAFFPQVW